MLELLMEGLRVCVDPLNMGLFMLATAFGIILGAIPGIGSTLAISLFLPVIFGMSPVVGTIVMIGVFNGSVYGGSVTAILINAPGTPGSVATCFDGYPLSRKGRASEALGISISASFFGGILSAICLILFLTPIAKLSLNFGPSQLFLIMIIALGTVSQLARENTLKGLISVCIGIMLGFIGYDVIIGVSRMTFGNVALGGGFNLVATLIGLYAIVEIMFMIQIESKTIAEDDAASRSLAIKDIMKGLITPYKNMKTLSVSSVVGAVVGVIPGIGVAVANLLAYSYAKMISKNPEEFGKGAVEGVIAPEAANNAVTATSLIPALALGIPGGASAAVILGGMMILGIIPGPMLVESNPQLIGGIMVGFLVTNVLMLVLGILMTNAYQYVTRVPLNYVVAIVLAFSCFGAFVARNNTIDLVLVLLIGFLAYAMRKAGYSIACLTLGFILSRMIEQYYHQAMMISGAQGARIFLTGSVNIVIILIGVAVFALPPLFKLIKTMRNKKTAES